MGVSIWEGNKAERVATALEVIAIGSAGGDVQGWAAYRNLVRNGLGPKAAPVGTILRTEKETSLTATMGTHTGITGVSVNEETFLSAEGVVGSGVHEFIFDGAAWIYNDVAVNLTTYGLTVEGTPANGDEIVVNEAFNEINWVVADYGYLVNHKYVPSSKVTGSTDKSHPAAALIMEHCINSRPISPRQAVIYCGEAMPAGAYKITIRNNAWYTDDNGKAYYFTLTEAKAIGAQGVLTQSYNATSAGASIQWFNNSTDTTVRETVTLSATAIAGATDLGETDGSAASGIMVNHMHRALLGNNNYKESAIREWLGSGAAASAWNTASGCVYDRPVSYANVAGFQHGLDADFLNAIQAVDVECKTNNTYENSGWTLNTAYTVRDKFFLASRDEVGFAVENVAEGGTWALYNGAANADRIKRDLSDQSTASYWWLRSPYPSNANDVRRVNTDGSLSGNRANSGYGAAAACIIG